jgi:hypothetical protein
VPLHITYCDTDEARTLYQAKRVLVRPDHHIAWRGNAACSAEQIQSIIDMICAN